MFNLSLFNRDPPPPPQEEDSNPPPAENKELDKDEVSCILLLQLWKEICS